MIPAIYYPTTVVFLDDNPIFLKDLKTLQNKYNSQIFLSVQIALQYIKDFSEALEAELCGDYLDDHSTKQVIFDIRSFRTQLAKQDKEKNPTVLVIDYDMPEMDGLTFCKRPECLYMYKILLTGVAGLPEVVQAFNDGTIDAYVSKGDPLYIEKVDHHIQLGQKLFFEKFSREIYKIIFANKDDRTYVFQQDFVDYFEKYVKENNVVEYCLIDDIGCFFMKKQDNPFGIALNIADKGRLQAMVESLPPNLRATFKEDIFEGRKVFDFSNFDEETIKKEQFCVASSISQDLKCWISINA